MSDEQREQYRSIVGIAAGCGGSGTELLRFTSLAGRWFTSRTITLDPHGGEPAPRMVESSSGLVHRVGEPNSGLEHFTGTELPELVRAGAKVMVSVSGRSTTDLVQLARRVGTAPGVRGVEVNLAPSASGLIHQTNPAAVADLVAQVRAVIPGGMAVHAKFGAEHGATHARLMAGVLDAVVITGATPAAMPDGRVGSLSGPAILPITAARVQAVRAAAPEVAITAVGGVRCASDVLALLRSGANRVQVGCALFQDPTLLDQILDDLTALHPLGAS